MASEASIVKYEDRLIARDKSFRGTYIGAMFLLLVSLVGVGWALSMAQSGHGIASDGSDMKTALVASIFLWAGVAFVQVEKRKHIRTIRRYRAKGEASRGNHV